MYDAAAPCPEAAEAPADGSLLKDVMNSVRLAMGGGERDRSRRLRHSGTQRRAVCSCVADRVEHETSHCNTAADYVWVFGHGCGRIAGICASASVEQQAMAQNTQDIVRHVICSSCSASSIAGTSLPLASDEADHVPTEIPPCHPNAVPVHLRWLASVSYDGLWRRPYDGTSRSDTAARGGFRGSLPAPGTDGIDASGLNASGPRPCPAMRFARCAAFFRLYVFLHGGRHNLPSYPCETKAWLVRCSVGNPTSCDMLRMPFVQGAHEISQQMQPDPAFSELSTPMHALWPRYPALRDGRLLLLRVPQHAGEPGDAEGGSRDLRSGQSRGQTPSAFTRSILRRPASVYPKNVWCSVSMRESHLCINGHPPGPILLFRLVLGVIRGVESGLNARRRRLAAV